MHIRSTKTQHVIFGCTSSHMILCEGSVLIMTIMMDPNTKSILTTLLVTGHYKHQAKSICNLPVVLSACVYVILTATWKATRYEMTPHLPNPHDGHGGCIQQQYPAQGVSTRNKTATWCRDHACHSTRLILKRCPWRCRHCAVLLPSRRIGDSDEWWLLLT